MSKVKANSQTFEQIKKAMSENFGNGNFKMWWEEDTLFIRIKEMSNNLSFFVVKSMLRICMPEVQIDIELIAFHSDFWKN